MGKRSCAYRAVGPALVMVFGEQSPNDREWEEWLGFLERTCPKDLRPLLVVSDGGGPNAIQRGRVEEWMSGRSYRTAVVTNSRIVRGITTAFHWLAGGDIRAFAPERMSEALAHLQIDPSSHSQLVQAVASLRAELKSA